LRGVGAGLFSGGTAQALPPIEPGKGRVFIYRDSTRGSPYVPDVLLNGERVGRLDQAGVIFRGVLARRYAVTSGRISTSVNFAMAAGERKYIRFSSGYFEQHMHPEMVDPASGGSGDCSLRIRRAGPSM